MPEQNSNSATPTDSASLREILVAGESGVVGLEYALLAAAIAVPMIWVIFFVIRVLSDMYMMQLLILNTPFL